MVEWKKLDEVCTVLTGGDAPKECVKGQTLPTVENPYPIYSNGDEIYGFCSTYRVKTDAVTISSIGNVGSVYYRTANFTPIIRLKVVIPSTQLLDTKFLYYSLLDYSFIGTNSSLSSMKAADIKRILIPIPSLEEQTRIVGILDTFTSAIDNLKEQIAQRRKQYEYYRDQLLDLEGKPGVEMKTLGEILILKKGEYITKKEAIEGIYPVILGGKEPAYFINRYNHVGKAIVISRSGASAGYVSFWNEPIFVTDGFLIEPHNNVTIEFLYYILKNKQRDLHGAQKGGAIPHITPTLIRAFIVAVPPLREQQRIVSILDTFEASIQNLEAQLKQREKQYEYYRNKLLSFE